MSPTTGNRNMAAQTGSTYISGTIIDKRKPSFCRGNFDAIYRSSGDINTSGLGSHISISGCRSLSQCPFFDIDVVGKLDFVTCVTTILIPDVFCHSSQHDRKISPVSCLTSCLTTSGALIDDLIVAFFTHSIYRSHQKTTPNAEQNFFADLKTELGLFLFPSAIGGLNDIGESNPVPASGL